MIGLAQQINRDLLENVLPCDVDQMQLNRGVRFALDWNLLQRVLTPLSHLVVMIEDLLGELVNDLCLADGGFARHDHSRSQNRHFYNLLLI